jgi:hypothetical protein
MSITNLIERRVDALVEGLFKENPPRYDKICTNPVTGSRYVGGLDPIEREKRLARSALRARESFAIHGPADCQPLPITDCERDEVKRRGLLGYLRALHARSVSTQEYEYYAEHPPFEEYVAGVLWESERPDGKIGGLPYRDQLAGLQKRFPPRMLAGMGPGFSWEPPDEHVQRTASGHRTARRR